MPQKIRSIEVVEYASGKVAHRIDVSGKSERDIDRVEAGMQHNLSDRFFLRQSTCGIPKGD